MNQENEKRVPNVNVATANIALLSPKVCHRVIGMHRGRQWDIILMTKFVCSALIHQRLVFKFNFLKPAEHKREGCMVELFLRPIPGFLDMSLQVFSAECSKGDSGPALL